MVSKTLARIIIFIPVLAILFLFSFLTVEVGIVVCSFFSTWATNYEAQRALDHTSVGFFTSMLWAALLLAIACFVAFRAAKGIGRATQRLFSPRSRLTTSIDGDHHLARFADMKYVPDRIIQYDGFFGEIYKRFQIGQLTRTQKKLSPFLESTKSNLSTSIDIERLQNQSQLKQSSQTLIDKPSDPPAIDITPKDKKSDGAIRAGKLIK
jgi:hypothetical protein